MKRTLYILSLLALLAPLAQAEAFSYTHQNVTTATKDQAVVGGAAGVMADGTATFTDYEGITISNNTTQNTYTSSHTTKDVYYGAGGGLYAAEAVEISNNTGDIAFENNILSFKTSNDGRSRVRGGAIKSGTVTIADNKSDILFSGNKVWDQTKAWVSGVQIDAPKFSAGGAIYGGNDIDVGTAGSVAAISITGNGSVTFNENEAGKGGAVASDYKTKMVISSNGQVTFSGNEAQYGGAVYTGVYVNISGTTNTPGYGTLEMTGNTGVTFSGNAARNSGGAIYSQNYGKVNISKNNGAVSFVNNGATALTGSIMGGAIRGNKGTEVSLNDNSGGVSFTGNYLTRSDTSPLYGGAISVDSSGVLNINGNANVVVRENYAYGSGGGVATGGAIAMYGAEFNLNNTKGDVQICDNYARTQNTTTFSKTVLGGAIYGSKSTTINILGNLGDVLLKGNKVIADGNGSSNVAQGGAIYTENALNIIGNKGVEFRGNVQQDSSGTILRSVYINSKTTTGALNLSAAAGGDITFYDSVYAAPNGTSYSLTTDFNKESGNTGKIVFSGLHAATDLAAVNADYSVDELAASQTSTIQSLLTLHQGTLSIEEAACLQTKGMTANVGSSVQLVNGRLQMLDSGALTLNGTLSATGSNTIEGSTITYGDGGKFNLTLTAANKERALLNLSGVSALSYGSAEINFLGVDGLAEGEYQLLDLTASETLAQAEWLTEGITYTGLTGNDSFKWDDSGTVLYLVHAPEPTTAMLSLLALAGFVARRRRKE